MAQVALQAPRKAFQANPLPVAGRSTAVARIPATQPLLKQSTAVHPAAIWISIGAFAWFVIAAWIGFAGDREAAVSIFMVGFINVMLIGLLAGGGWYSRNDSGAIHDAVVPRLRQRSRRYGDRQDNRPRSIVANHCTARDSRDRRHDHHRSRRVEWRWWMRKSKANGAPSDTVYPKGFDVSQA